MSRFSSLASFSVLALLVLVAACPVAGAEALTENNQQAPLGNLLLQNLGNKTAVISSLTWSEGVLTRSQVWRSKAGAFDASGAQFVVADFTGDGLPDALTLRPKGKRGARIDLFASDGDILKRSTPWQSTRAGFKAAAVKLAAGDIDNDGAAELLLLTPYGKRGARVISFSFDEGKAVRRTVFTSKKVAFALSSAQFTCGDLNGDGRADGVVLGRTSKGAILQGFRSNGSKLVSSYTWRGALSAASRLTAGSTQGKSRAEALVLRPVSKSRAVVERFTVKGSGFTRSRIWSGSLDMGGARLSCADLDGDGRSDLLALTRKGKSGSQVTVFLSDFRLLSKRTAWSSSIAASRLQLASGSSLPVILADDTKVLGDFEAGLLLSVVESPPPPDPLPDDHVQQYLLTFAGAGPQGLAVGDVLVLGPCDAAPDGLLHKVNRIEPQGDVTLMETEQASLEDAVQSVDLNYEHEVAVDELEEPTFEREGVRLMTTPAGRKDFGFKFRWEIDVEHDGLEAKGELTLEQRFDMNVRISWFKLKSARFASTTTQTSELSLTKKGAWSAEKEWTIASYPLKTITIQVGPLPVVVKPALEIYVGASGTIEAGITTGVYQEASVTIGADYVRGRRPAFGNLSKASFDAGFDPPRPTLSAELKGFAGIKLATKIYGVAGPYAALQGFGKVTADIGADPWWSLDVGLESQVGFEVKALKFKYGYTFTLFEYTLARADNARDPPPEDPAIHVATVTNGADGPLVRVGDPVTWRYTVTNPGNVPLGQVSVTDDELAVFPTYKNGDANGDGKLGTSETWVFEATGTAAAGEYTNIGTAYGTSPAGTRVAHADGSGYFGSDARIHIVTVTNGSDGPDVRTGSPITWTYTVTNPGNAPLSGVSVDDSVLVAGSDPVYKSGDTNGDGRLGTTETWVFKASGTAVAGEYTNTGTAYGTGAAGEAVSHSDGSSYFGADPKIHVETVTNGADGPYIHVGGAVIWTYTVTNTGNVPLVQVSVTDDQLASDPAFVGGDTNMNDHLDLDETWVFRASTTAVAGSYTNTGTAYGTVLIGGVANLVSHSDDSSYFGSDPGISVATVTNGADGVFVAVGSPIVWTYTVQNLGNVPLSGVRVDDDKLAPADDPVYKSGDVDGNGLLDLAETWVFEATGTAVAGDYSNTGTAYGTGPADDTVQASDGSSYKGLEPPSVDRFPIADGTMPAVSGDVVVWAGQGDDGPGIYGRDLAAGLDFVVKAGDEVWVQDGPAISGHTVVWIDWSDGNYNVRGYDLTTKTEFEICADSDYKHSLAISGDTVVWVNSQSDGSYIRGYDLPSKADFVAVDGVAWGSDHATVAISGDTVVWYGLGESGEGARGIYGRNLNGGSQFVISSRAGAWAPAISGDTVVWIEELSIRGYDLGTESEFSIWTGDHDLIDRLHHPAIDGRTVAWAEYGNNEWVIRGYDLETRIDYLITDAFGDDYAQPEPAISGNLVVWNNYYDRYEQDIWGARLTTP